MLNIIIVNYFSSKEINHNLSRYQKIKSKIRNKINFIIVDNSGEFILNENSLHDSINILRASGNLGYCGGNNLGYKYINNNYPGSDILICNPDVKIDFIQLDNMIDIIFDFDCGLYSIPAINENQELLYYSVKLNGLLESYIKTEPNEILIETDYCPGSYIYIKNNIQDITYLFDERFFMYWEEVDLALRFKKYGLPAFMITNIGYIERHSNDYSRIYNAIYYHVRNSFLLRNKYSSEMSRFDLVLFVIIKFLVFLKKAIISKDIRILKSYTKGLLDGFCKKFGK